ncbi:DnaJ-domain-containing protein [Hypoxylon sp. NC0597]|nr:DnaJ-domain-containing protein [Hypoxylon sp. NC0597]
MIGIIFQCVRDHCELLHISIPSQALTYQAGDHISMMNPFEEPDVPDYYADLELSQQASFRDIKSAFHRLAKKHHPDKKAPGKSIDASEFRKIREAYECLNDKNRRAAYDLLYFDLRDQWTRHKEWVANQHKKEENRRAEEDLRAARERAEKERQEAEAQRMRRAEEQKRAAREKAEQERIRKEKERRAEERSQEAARKAREQQEQAARERLRRERMKEAGKRSEEVARKVRIEQERAAQERLKAILIEEKQDAARRNWAKMRQEADRRGEAGKSQAEARRFMPATSPRCNHPRFGWFKKRGTASCVFCGEKRLKWSFYCPECSVSACPGCKANYCIL